MRSKLYLKSAAVTSRLTGGWNLTPSRRWKVYTVPSAEMPPFSALGTSVARQGMSSVPACAGLVRVLQEPLVDVVLDLPVDDVPGHRRVQARGLGEIRERERAALLGLV